MNFRAKASSQMKQILFIKNGNSALNRDYHNLAATKKSLMRLCAFAVVSGRPIGDAEKLVIANIIVRRYLNRNVDELAQVYKMLSGVDLIHENGRYVNDDEIADSLNPYIKEYVQSTGQVDDGFYHACLQKLFVAKKIVEEISGQLLDAENPDYAETRKSILMNIDSLSKKRIYIELCDIMLVVKADKALVDCERAAFRVFCKALRIVQTTSLWQELSECDEKVLWRLSSRNYVHLLKQKRNVDINDCRSIESSIDFYNIQGPLVDGIYYCLQRVHTRYQDMTFYNNRKWTNRAFVVFVLTSLIIFLKVSYPQLESVNVLRAIQASCDLPSWVGEMPDIGISCGEQECNAGATLIPTVAVICVLIVVGIWFFQLSLPRHFKSILSHWIRRLRGRNTVLWLLFLSVSIVVTLVFLLLTFCLLLLFQPLCVLGLTLSIEWMCFMQEYLHERIHPKKSYTLVWIVVASTVADVSMSIAEHYNHFHVQTPNYVDIIASALFSGCLSFIFGKWLENHRMMTQHTQDEIKQIVEHIGKRVEV